MPACRLKIAILLLLVGWSGSQCRAQLRIVDYNLGEWTAARAAQSELDHGAGDLADVLQAIGLQNVGGIAKPADIFALQEQTFTTTTTQAVVDVLNGIYGAGTYARSSINAGTTGGGRPALIYNTQTVQFLEEVTTGVATSTGAPRQGMRYKLRPAGYDATADFFLYVNHYKSDTGTDSNGILNSERRNIEATGVRANADALGNGVHIIYAGDFNVYNSTEPAYQTLLAAGNGQAFDPINTPGSWSGNNTFKSVHTQSPVATGDTRYGGQVAGGVDDRFDFQLVTNEFLDGEGLSYIGDRNYANDTTGGVVESYRAFGNNGTHVCCNSGINTGTGASPLVLNALMNTTDHLPVVVDYQIPAVMQVTAAVIPPRLVKTATGPTASLSVANTVNVVAASGGDELDYQVSASGSVTTNTGTTGVVNALAAAAAPTVRLTTATTGAKTGTINVNSSSQAVKNGSFTQNVNFAVVDPANASFSTVTDLNTLALDLGAALVGATSPMMNFSLANLVTTVGFTSALDLDSIVPSGASSVLTTNLASFVNLAAGGANAFAAQLATTAAGVFSASYTLNLSDENIPGQTTQALTLELSGRVILGGDFNRDGFVDAADYTTWRDTLGTTVAAIGDGADGSLNGVIDAADYDVWASRFGASAVVAANSVPEPGAILLLAVGLAAMWVAPTFGRD